MIRILQRAIANELLLTGADMTDDVAMHTAACIIRRVRRDFVDEWHDMVYDSAMLSARWIGDQENNR